MGWVTIKIKDGEVVDAYEKDGIVYTDDSPYANYIGRLYDDVDVYSEVGGFPWEKTGEKY